MTDEEMVAALVPIKESIDRLRSDVNQVSNDLNKLWAAYTHRTSPTPAPAEKTRKLVRRQ